VRDHSLAWSILADHLRICTMALVCIGRRRAWVRAISSARYGLGIAAD
jgi:hypothetical protein